MVWENIWGDYRLRAGGEEGNRRWDGWMASSTQWIWVWANSRRWWRTGKPGMLLSMGSQRVRHNLAKEQEPLGWQRPRLCLSSAAAVTSVMSNSVQPHRRQPTTLPRPWDSPGKNTGVGCHFLLQCMKVKSESEVTESCPTLSNPMDCSLPGSSIHGIFQARALEWGAITFSIKYTWF